MHKNSATHRELLQIGRKHFLFTQCVALWGRSPEREGILWISKGLQCHKCQPFLIVHRDLTVEIDCYNKSIQCNKQYFATVIPQQQIHCYSPHILRKFSSAAAEDRDPSRAAITSLHCSACMLTDQLSGMFREFSGSLIILSLTNDVQDLLLPPPSFNTLLRSLWVETHTHTHTCSGAWIWCCNLRIDFSKVDDTRREWVADGRSWSCGTRPSILWNTRNIQIS
jgi:hypothetical protein